MRAMAVVLTLALWLAAGATFAQAQVPDDASVNGSVSDAVSGAPIAGAVVSATGSLGDRYSTTTDGLGDFAFDDVVAPESYTLDYEAAGYQHATNSSGPLTAGETITILETLAPLPGAVAGVVRDQSGPLYGMIVTVQARPSGFPYRVTSGPDGSFTVGGLDPGSYQLTVQDGNTPVPEGTEVGQAQVRIVRASLATGHHRAKLRWVDNSTREIGPYLAGGILIPVKPLRSGSLYHASVTVADGTRMLIDNWSFRTARNRRGAHPESGEPHERSGHGDRHWPTKRGAGR
jgi:hypothetical protein